MSVPRAILLVVLLLIATRPVVDLFGQYEGTGINPGGVVGLVTASLILLYSLLTPWKLPKLLVPAVFSYLFLVLAPLIVSPWNGLPAPASWARMFVGLAPVMLFTSLGAIPSRRNVRLFRRTIWLFLICCLAPVVIAWLQLLGLQEFTYFDYVGGARIGRPSGGYFQPNSLGRLMVFAVILVYALKWNRKISIRFATILILVFTATAFISTHRTSLIALIAVLALFLSYDLLRVQGLSRNRLGILLLTIGMSSIFLLVGVSIFAGSVLAERLYLNVEALFGAFSTLSPDAFGEDYFLRGRGAIWEQVVELFRNAGLSSQIFGLGYEPIEAHNDVLRILLVHGVFGIAVFGIFFLSLYTWAMAKASSRGKVIAGATFTFLLLFSVTLHPTAYPLFMWLFLFILICTVTFFPTNTLRLDDHS